MAQLEKCDGEGCNKMTPNENGKHIGNGWYEVLVQPRRDRNMYTKTERKIVLCEECYEKTGLQNYNWTYSNR